MPDISTKELLYILREDFPKLKEFDWALPHIWCLEIVTRVGVPYHWLTTGTLWGYFENGGPFDDPIFQDPLAAAVYQCYLDIEAGKEEA